MKQTLFLIAFILVTIMSNAQQQPTCHPVTEFSAFAKEESFRAAHEEPLPYEYAGEGEMVSFSVPDGKEGKAFLIKADKPTKNYLFVFHEWWGLNDLTKKQAADFQKDLGNVNVLAIDLYDGKVTTNRDEAGKLMQALDPKRAEAIIQGAVKYAGKDARIFTIGWCLGGGWALQASLIAGKQGTGTVMYYGAPEKSVPKLKTLNGDVLAIFASKDQWITQDMAKEFDANMKAAGKRIDIVSFDADHAFANPSNPVYDKDATEKAYKYSVDFLKQRLQ